jgi:hypothetical protein
MQLRTETLRVLKPYLSDQWLVPLLLPRGRIQTDRKITLRLCERGLLEKRKLQEPISGIDPRGQHKVYEYRITWYGLVLAYEYLWRERKVYAPVVRVTKNKQPVYGKPVNSVFSLGAL